MKVFEEIEDPVLRTQFSEIIDIIHRIEYRISKIEQFITEFDESKDYDIKKYIMENRGY